MRVWACERWVCVWMCRCLYTRACVCVQYIYIYESEQGASKEREPTGGEEKERKSRLIRETRMRKGSNCQPGCETNSRLSSSGG